jgi:Zn-dependent M28 family amino/carboxypeptidase
MVDWQDGLQERLRSHLLQLVRERDPYMATQGYFFVREYIQEQLGRFGNVQIHEFEYSGDTHQNFVLDLPDQDGRWDRPLILIGAHYDAVPGTPGADDNASGVAGLLELAQCFAQSPARYPVRLVAFDLEEFGMVGSERYAADLKQASQKIRLMLSLEMLGYCVQESNSQNYPAGLEKLYPDTGNFIALVGNLPAVPAMMHLKRAMGQYSVPCEWLPAGMRGQMLSSTRLSDHSPFWDRGYRAIMVTDTAFMRNPHYHQRSDRLETLDLEFMTGVCTGLAVGLQTLR